MIDESYRNAIYHLHCEGMGYREIARRLNISRNTVKKIVSQKGQVPLITRNDKRVVDGELLEALYRECDRRVRRVFEKLTEDYGFSLSYSTVWRRLKELNISGPVDTRCHRVPDVPGDEMQHDTSQYHVLLGDRRVRVVASLLYFRYSKVRYLKFYRSFNRFCMKCFLHEALVFWGYSARICIIDNTNLARLRGTGKHAVMAPEMAAFSKRYGFKFQCHEIGHSNRKAGNERGFFTIATNFLPGRTFSSLEDLNRQAVEWATERMANRPVGKTRLIPSQAFEYEKKSLIPLPKYLPAPYQSLSRTIDQYGYIAVEGNYYWIPGTGRGMRTVLRYSDRIVVYDGRKQLIDYPIPADGMKNQKITPPGFSGMTRQPKNRKKPVEEERKALENICPQITPFLEMVKKNGHPIHRYIRELWNLSRRTGKKIFNAAIERALKYTVTDILTIENMCAMLVTEQRVIPPVLEPEQDDVYGRDAYQEGRFGGDVDLTIYDRWMEENDHE